MLRVTMALSLAGLLTACGSETSGDFTTEDGEAGEYSLDSESGETTASIETPDGTATLRSGPNVPVELPEGFSLYPGAKVVSNSTVSQNGRDRVVLLAFETSDSSQEVAEYYKQQAENAGVEIQIDATINGGHMVAGEAPDGSVFSLNSSSEDGTTTAQLTTGLRLGE